MRLREFIKQNRNEIDAKIKCVAPNIRINDGEREDWIMNDEGLYYWAQTAGVRV